MPAQSFENIQDILKDTYGKAIIYQAYRRSPLFAIIKKKTADFAGKRLIIPLQTAFAESVAARTPGDYALPDPQRNYYDQAILQMKRVYGRVKIDNFAIESAKGEGGWEDPLTREMKGVAEAFAMEIDRMLLGDGKGILAVVAGTGTGYLTVTKAGGVSTDTTRPTRFFRRGMLIRTYNSTSGFTGTYIVNGIDPATNKILVSKLSGDGASASDEIYVYGAFNGTDYGELMGIRGVISTSNAPTSNDFEGIDRTTEEWWRAYVNSTSATLSEAMIQNDLDDISLRSAGEPVDLIITTFALRNKLISLMQALRKVETLEFQAGWKAIKYIGGEVELPILAHPNAPTGYVFYVSLPHLRLYTLKGLTWDEKGGMIKPVAGEDAVEAWFKFYANLGTDCSNAHGLHTGVTT